MKQSKKEIKLTNQLKKHLLNIAKSFADNQKIFSDKEFDCKLSLLKENYIKENTSSEDIIKVQKEYYKVKKEYDLVDERYRSKKRRI